MDKADLKQDKKMMAGAVHKHEKRMHPGKPMTKFAKGGKTDMDIFPQQWAQPVHEHDLEVLANGGTHRYREYCPIGDGEPIPWDACKFRLQGIDGGYLIGGVALDVSGATDPSCYGLPRA